jgi:osmotically-inducible protein OsmY
MVHGVTQTMHRSDQVLQATVSDELLFIPSVDSHLAVSAVDGVVTLEGDVASVPERLAAVEAAEGVWGVHNVTDRTVVRSAGASGANDDELAEAAKSMLEWSVDVPPNAVKVQVSQRKITLTGVVIWHFQREAATRAVLYMRGITGVDNKITIHEVTTVSITTDAVEAAIGRNLPMYTRAIAVGVHDHTLTLSGTVGSSTQRRRVERLAWAAAGVTTVENNLVIAA